jgi:hypothetical protein
MPAPTITTSASCIATVPFRPIARCRDISGWAPTVGQCETILSWTIVRISRAREPRYFNCSAGLRARNDHVAKGSEVSFSRRRSKSLDPGALVTLMTDGTTRRHPTPGLSATGGEHECIQPGARGTPPVARNRRAAAFPMSAECPKARDIEAIAMSSQHAGPTAQYTRPRGRQRWRRNRRTMGRDGQADPWRRTLIRATRRFFSWPVQGTRGVVRCLRGIF